MSQGAALTIQPDLLVDRSALAGAVLGVAAELRLAACDVRRAWVDRGEIDATVNLAHVRLSSLGGAEVLGVAVVYEHGAFVLHRSADSETAVQAVGGAPCGADPSAASQNAASHNAASVPVTAEEFARCLNRQLVLRRLVSTLRTNGFAIVQRGETPNGTITLRARLPLVHQSRPTARTAHPEFAVSVDDRGMVEARLAGLHCDSRQYVEDLLARALCDATEAVARRRARLRVHAA